MVIMLSFTGRSQSMKQRPLNVKIHSCPESRMLSSLADEMTRSRSNMCISKHVGMFAERGWMRT